MQRWFQPCCSGIRGVSGRICCIRRDPRTCSLLARSGVTLLQGVDRHGGVPGLKTLEDDLTGGDKGNRKKGPGYAADGTTHEDADDDHELRDADGIAHDDRH